jgi:formate transporter
MFVLAILAGVFIALGAEFYTLVTHDSGLAFGLNSLIGGLVFCLGLILVVIAGAELFTGNTLIVMGFIEGRVRARQLLKGWSIVYVGNFVGSLAMVLLIYYTAQWGFHGAMVGGKALLIANAKVNMSFLEAFMRGILCNVLVCLAIWLAFSGRSTTDKILAVVFPITAFVASGFEHCVANMYFVPIGLALKAKPDVVAAAGTMAGQPGQYHRWEPSGWGHLLVSVPPKVLLWKPVSGCSGGLPSHFSLQPPRALSETGGSQLLELL